MTDPRDHARYADWDGAYVLGALSSAERREYEAHLETCDRCRVAVADLSGLPGLLGRVDPERARTLLEVEVAEAAVPPPSVDLVSRIEAGERRRRMRSWRVVAGVAAAAVVVGAVAVPVAIAVQPHPTVSVALRSPSVPLTADLALTDVTWGTRIDMRCGYAEAAAAGDGNREWDYALWVVDRTGAASEVSTWKARTGSQVRLSAATSLSIGQIAAIQVRSAAGAVLLSKGL
ncbi:zf-HC2 domain-containing protein [Pseudolysinimonas sp.]|uniref:zf-HC2 domain-containing protein n=1 Tax=Pseudolysinimonas sp. TaxID=2680009 RepID=UPI003F810C81